MASGRINLQANDGKVAGVVFEDGASSNVTVTIPKEGGVLATQSGLDTAMSTINASVPAAYHIYNGQLALSNTVTTAGFSTTLYTGNGTTQSVVTGVDMDTQWGNDASEKFGGLVWVKSRSVIQGHRLFDTLNGVNKYLASDATHSLLSVASTLTSFSNNGFSLGSAPDSNANAATYASWNFQTTHRVSGTTNHGKAYTCHYNPYTGFTIVKYEGSGLAGHEIPHYLGRKLGVTVYKNLTAVSNWSVVNTFIDGVLCLNTNAAITGSGFSVQLAENTNTLFTASDVTGNAPSNTYIMYGWANSYFDEKNTLIGNYEIGAYQGTGAAGNKVTTRGKPAWVMVKRLDGVGNWRIFDNQRPYTLFPSTPTAETNESNKPTFNSDGFIVNTTDTENNASGGQYLYMVVYDNDSGSGKSKYPRATDTSTLNLNAHVPFANGIDTTGSKVSIAYKNETITLSNALVQGKNYIALLNDGSYVATATKPSYGLTNPSSGDFFNLDTQKWYNNSNVEITPRNYLDCIVYADQNGQPEYVEQIEKVQYFDGVKANEFKGKNACTAWVNFDGTTTPPTIRDSYNVSSVVRTGTGYYDVYFTTPMDNVNYSLNSNANDTGAWGTVSTIGTKNTNKSSIFLTVNNGTSNSNAGIIDVHIFGGKN